MRVVIIILSVVAVILLMISAGIYYIVQLANKLKDLDVLQIEDDEKAEAEN